MASPANATILTLEQSKTVRPDMTAVAWSPDGKTLATASPGHRDVIVWDSASLREIRRLNQTVRGGGRSHVTFSNDGRLLASGLRTINVWDTQTWELRFGLVAPQITPEVPQGMGVRGLVITSDRKMIIAAYEGKQRAVVAFSLTDGEIVWNRQIQALITTPLVLSPDGSVILFGTGHSFYSADGDLQRRSQVVALSVSNGEVSRTIDNVHVESPTALAISRDGKWIATGTTTGTENSTVNLKTKRGAMLQNKDPIRVWEFRTGKLAKELPIASRVWALGFTTDGKYLVSSRSDLERKTLAVWALDSKEMVQQVESWPGALDMALSSDGRRLALAAGSSLFVFRIAHQ